MFNQIEFIKFIKLQIKKPSNCFEFFLIKKPYDIESQNESNSKKKRFLSVITVKETQK